MLHQLYAVGVGQHQIEQDQVGPFRLDEVRQVMVVAGYQGQVVGLCKRVADEAQRLRVVVDHEDARLLFLFRARARTAVAGCGRGVAASFLGHRDREGEAGALAGAGALGPDASSVRLHQTLADGEPEAAHDPVLPIGDANSGILPEQVGQSLRRDAAAFVAHRDRDVHSLAHRGDARIGADWGEWRAALEKRLFRTCNDTAPVGHHAGEIRRKVDEDGVRAAAAQEGCSSPGPPGPPPPWARAPPRACPNRCAAPSSRSLMRPRM